MGMHKDRKPLRGKKIKDPFARKVTLSFAQRIVALRLQHNLPRLTVVQSAGIYWKRIRRLEEARTVPTIDELVKLAGLYRVSHVAPLKHTLHDRHRS